MKKLTIPDVAKKDLKLTVYLLVNGVVAYLSQKYLTNNAELALVFGGVANYVTYRVTQELDNSGYLRALKG